ncbi:MAG TPA: ANTAR domain-containing protein [Microlunatus sp.]|jgi:hypothetical protein|nr:ANTAR domain-containing protein [Microlunatus sp.]
MTIPAASDPTDIPAAADQDGQVRPRSDGRHPLRHTEVPGAVDHRAVIYEVTNLRAQLETLPLIEQSKGILMGRYQISADAAFALLRRWSSHTNVKLREISRLLVEAAGQPAAGSSPSLTVHASSKLDRLIAALTAGSLPEDAARAREDGGR